MSDRNLFEVNTLELPARELKTLPANLGEAVELFAESELMKQTLGDHIHSYLVAHKRKEWAEYSLQVTPWELEHYLAVL